MHPGADALLSLVRVEFTLNSWYELAFMKNAVTAREDSELSEKHSATLKLVELTWNPWEHQWSRPGRLQLPVMV